MEFFEKPVAVRLKTHLDKYLVADDDQVTVRQSLSAGGTRRARWLVDHVDSNSHVIRLKSCYGSYLTASDTPCSLMMGKKVIQKSLPESTKEQLAMEWQPVRDGFQVKLKTSCGTYLRANGPMLRNTVTHDTCFTHNWMLFDVEAVDIPEDEEFDDYMSMITSFSSVSDELSGLEFTSLHSSPRTPILSFIKRSPFQQASVMDFFHNAKAVRLKNHHNKYLYADEDQESVSQDRNGASKNNRWTVEFVTDTHIRLKSCYNKYLTASNQPFLLGMTGRKVLQTLPPRLDSSLEWEPIREGNQVKLRTRYGQYLRANGGLPPWRNSVTHDIPHRTATLEWILWDVDVVDIVVQSPAPRPPPPLVPSDSFTSNDSSSPTTSWSFQEVCFSWSKHIHTYVHTMLLLLFSLIKLTIDELICVLQSSPAKIDQGRAIYYHVVSDDFGEMDEDAQGFCITFKGNEVGELTRKLEEETGLKGITVCTRSPLDGNLYPLRLQLPPNNVTMKVVVVHNSSSQE
ncbi:putative actin-crosslinking [Helianthus anomalus]